jgi:hypothetical protein
MCTSVGDFDWMNSQSPHKAKHKSSHKASATTSGADAHEDAGATAVERLAIKRSNVAVLISPCRKLPCSCLAVIFIILLGHENVILFLRCIKLSA